VRVRALFATLPWVFACTAITTRPSFRPFPLAPADTVPAQPPAVIEDAARRLAEMGLRVQVAVPAEGYLETRWYHPETGRSFRANEDPGSLFRVRVWADLVTPSQTRIVVESVYRNVVDPSLPPRVDERVAPPGSPGDSVATRLLVAMDQRFTGAAP
jgi:hypothetical protein